MSKKSRSTEANLQKLLRVLIYIEEHLDDPLSLEQLARVACISPYHFHRIFKGYVGETVKGYVRRLRLERASGKLQYTDAPVTEIGLDAGFETPSAFSRIFKQLMGLSPQAYRKALRPVVRLVVERTLSNRGGGAMMRPTMCERKEESVLFVRRLGDYDQAPREAFIALKEHLKEQGIVDSVKAYYSMALDNPNVTSKEALRFDACAVVPAPQAFGEVGVRVIPGGRYAMFEHVGPYAELGQTFERIFSEWYPSSGEEVADKPYLCEHLDLGDREKADSERVTRIYIPLK